MEAPDITDHEAEGNAAGDSASVTDILLKNSSITVKGTGFAVKGSYAILTSGGIYHISGIPADGQVIINTAQEEDVSLILDGAGQGPPEKLVNKPGQTAGTWSEKRKLL